jgi:hypothetical protein
MSVPLPFYDITNWYWAVGDQSPSTQVYSTASNSFVPLSNTTYTAWLAAGGVTTVIDTMVNLYGVFNQQNITSYLPNSQTYSSSVDVTLTNPIPSTVYVTMSVPGKKVILPRMDTPNGIYVGGRFQITNNSGSINFDVVANDGTTLIATIPANGYAFFTLTANNTANGTIQQQIGSTVGPKLSIKIVVITASGTYTPTAGMTSCIAEVIGGGGGGGGAVGGSAAGWYSGGGGGSGSYAKRALSAATIGVSQSVTIGAGGSSSAGGNGTAGGDTSLGALVLAHGGGGGLACTPSQLGTGGAGGNVGTGDFIAGGASGHSGSFNNIATAASIGVPGAPGGSSAYGGGAPATANNTAVGNPALPFGSGGGGAVSVDTTARAGGGGSAGVAIITEYIFS